MLELVEQAGERTKIKVDDPVYLGFSVYREKMTHDIEIFLRLNSRTVAMRRPPTTPSGGGWPHRVQTYRPYSRSPHSEL
jgi:hypothetical protein